VACLIRVSQGLLQQPEDDLWEHFPLANETVTMGLAVK
jgi:hypothetical protein